MNRKKVVIISRAIFPFIAPRSMRATELAKEFARQGFDVTLYGVLGKFDYSNFEEKHKIKVKDLGPTKFATLNSDGENKISILGRIMRKAFKKAIEFPDIELAFHVNKILKKENDINLLITIAVPFPIHWGVAYRKGRNSKHFAKTWVADCGDPYMGNKFHKRAFYFKYVEKWFCKNADFITIPIEDARSAYYTEFQHKIKVIPQGFDFSNINQDQKEANNKVLTFIYAGVFYEKIRDPRLFLDYLIQQRNYSFLFIIYTKSKALIEPYKELLKDKLEVRDYIPREELLSEMSKADFLVNFENNTTIQSPSKLIDYALAKRPILSINSSESLDEIKIKEFLNKDYSQSLKIQDVEQYNITNVVKQFSKLM